MIGVLARLAYTLHAVSDGVPWELEFTTLDEAVAYGAFVERMGEASVRRITRADGTDVPGWALAVRSVRRAQDESEGARDAARDD